MDYKLRESDQYIKFRSSIPLKKLFVDDQTDGNNNNDLAWKVYDAGNKNINQPIVFLPPAATSADIFYKQLLFLSERGLRAIALDYPAYATVDDFCCGFAKVLDALNLLRVHVFGSCLGGFLILKFAEQTRYKRLVASLLLCNAFADNWRSSASGVSTGWLSVMPRFFLKRLVARDLDPTADHQRRNCHNDDNDCRHKHVVEFVASDTLPRKQLIARLQCRLRQDEARNLDRLQSFPVTVITTLDDNPCFDREKDELFKCFPRARYADLKCGGRFPYLTRINEVNLHLALHLRHFTARSGSFGAAV